MQSKSIFLIIVFWVEVILSARVLMFTFPVLVSRQLKGIGAASLSDWTMLTITIIAIYYLLTGLASILAHRAWKIFHFLGLILTLLLSIGLVNRVANIHGEVSFSYFIPIIISVLFTFCVIFNKEGSKGAAPSHLRRI